MLTPYCCLVFGWLVFNVSPGTHIRIAFQLWSMWTAWLPYLIKKKNWTRWDLDWATSVPGCRDARLSGCSMSTRQREQISEIIWTPFTPVIHPAGLLLELEPVHLSNMAPGDSFWLVAFYCCCCVSLGGWDGMLSLIGGVCPLDDVVVTCWVLGEWLLHGEFRECWWMVGGGCVLIYELISLCSPPAAFTAACTPRYPNPPGSGAYVVFYYGYDNV